jgi:hypothetical protein
MASFECVQKLASRFRKADQCREAMKWLDRIGRSLPDYEGHATAVERTEAPFARLQALHTAAVEHCRPRMTDFVTDTEDRKLAYEDYKDGKRLAKERRWNEARTAYLNALDLVDEPVIRRRLATVELRLSGCGALLKILGKIPGRARSNSDVNRRWACSAGKPTTPVGRDDLSKYVRFVSKALSNSAQRTFQQKVTSAHRAFHKGGNPLIHRRLSERFARAGNCEAMRHHNEGLTPELRTSVPLYADLTKCGAPAPDLVVEDKIRELPEFDEPEDVGPPSGVWGSVHFGAGASIIGVNPDLARKSEVVSVGLALGGGVTVHLGRRFALFADALSQSISLQESELHDSWDEYAVQHILISFGLEGYLYHGEVFAMSLFGGGGFNQFLADADNGTDSYNWGGPEGLASLGANFRIFPHRRFELGLTGRLDLLFGGDNDEDQEWVSKGAPDHFGTAFSVVFRAAVHFGH